MTLIEQINLVNSVDRLQVLLAITLTLCVVNTLLFMYLVLVSKPKSEKNSDSEMFVKKIPKESTEKLDHNDQRLITYDRLFKIYTPLVKRTNIFIDYVDYESLAVVMDFDCEKVRIFQILWNNIEFAYGSALKEFNYETSTYNSFIEKWQSLLDWDMTEESIQVFEEVIRPQFKNINSPTVENL